MGYSNINVHIKLNHEVTVEEIQKFLDESGYDTYSQQGDYLTVTAPSVEFENFELLSMELSSQYPIPVLSVLVYDSDLVALSVFLNGEKMLEEVVSDDERVQMDREEFVKLFVPEHSVEELNGILDSAEIFYEDIVCKLNGLFGINLMLE